MLRAQDVPCSHVVDLRRLEPIDLEAPDADGAVLRGRGQVSQATAQPAAHPLGRLDMTPAEGTALLRSEATA